MILICFNILSNLYTKNSSKYFVRKSIAEILFLDMTVELQHLKSQNFGVLTADFCSARMLFLVRLFQTYSRY